MINVARITQRELVIQAMTHPRIWPSSSDDFSPPANEVAVDVNGQIYLGCWNSQYLGCFLFHPHNTVLWECHTMLLPAAWGPQAVDCSLVALEWVWANLPTKRLITSVPANNIMALRFARKCGFVEFGINPRSIQKGGILMDQHMLGIDCPAKEI